MIESRLWRIASSGLLLLLASTPAMAQADFTGTWGARYQEDFPERIPGPELGDYLGLPINASARQFADSWDPSRITLPEEQCRVHVSPYIYRGPLNLRIWEERDPDTQELVAIKHHISTYDQTRTIYMDGRPHPPEIAAHTWKGFSTGRWLGDMRVVEGVRPTGVVLGYQLGEARCYKECKDRFHLPKIAIDGGAERMYSEFADKLQQAR